MSRPKVHRAREDDPLNAGRHGVYQAGLQIGDHPALEALPRLPGSAYVPERGRAQLPKLLLGGRPTREGFREAL